MSGKWYTDEQIENVRRCIDSLFTDTRHYGVLHAALDALTRENADRAAEFGVDISMSTVCGRRHPGEVR